MNDNNNNKNKNKNKKTKYEQMTDDFVGAGFHRLDENLISIRPPKINWGNLYREKFDDTRKIEYLEKLASTMNHAAALIQDERNQLNGLMEKKEAQLESMAKAIEANNEMLQSEVTRMNAERQGYNREIKRLNNKIRELEK